MIPCRRWLRGAAAAVAVSLAEPVFAPAASPTDIVTYEIVSDTIPVVNIDYMRQEGRSFTPSIPLPWRMDGPLDDAEGPTGRGAQLRAE